MEDNLKYFTEFVEKHKGELVLEGFDVVMLEGFEDIPDDDYYYVVTGKQGTFWLSCVADLYPLKDVLPEAQYNRMLETYKLNVEWWKSLAERQVTDNKMSAWENKWFGDACEQRV